MMVLDFVTGLVKLWHGYNSDLSYCKQLTPQQLPASRSPDTPPAISTQARLVTEPLQERTKPRSNHLKEPAIDSEALALLIEKGKQATIRSAAKQLGIAVRVNGRYQRLDYLRAQIKFILKFHPYQVAQVFSEVAEVTEEAA